ncbi:O-succinylhomoserine sulfhydrylase [Kineosporia sp. R_H_3]|uniref:O-succinylhomoserine sulfhydrylase n=1 Tax=Kineosporia sp. R_H_3 TaxID=1961848 RepID=UPI000B4B5166|nr:O-succinylhomoserine sulfhydrylase [Kineosporia sp. R_H_3]
MSAREGGRLGTDGPRQGPTAAELATWRPDTLAVRGGVARSSFDEVSEAVFLTQGYVYADAAQAEGAFAGDVDHYMYSRYGNPTISVFEERLRLLEGADDCFATATGMAAVFNSLIAFLKAGDRVVAARALFGSCFVILDELLPRWGITCDFVDGHDLDQWAQALSTPAQAVFFESPSNPMQDLVDVAAVCELAHAAGAKVVVDNVFATPLLQKPLDLGADVVVYSATKHIDGQGRVLGGAILGDREYIRGGVETLMRHTGPSMSPFTAWVLLKGLETMGLRVDRQCSSALTVAEHLDAHPRVRSVRYPFLPSHPQHDLAKRQMRAGGTVVTFDVDPAGPGEGAAKDTAFAVLDALRIVDISNNLGDAKSLVTHPATTTHRRMTREARAAAGITDSTVRVSVGLEDVADLVADLDQALGAL